ncbi:MAG: hypothetical protein A2015_02480 [Spirochaetes bacterium GWF1_31_7]|nr:MAG: hypothetical protein A2Y30_04950 [Spirochaetes bacterium GWE1_32_154]OHD52898.1 MAG: hypothetical protein A2Y29_10660 [Spirochaetes bacterium GWE2_31_10]OHD53147.1 MAG: hypothetical protein A2015_02480 [Spirochaetes bacterium GWF1_31_7]OHD75894.1 MAG: hypothetical protein A2355_04060 [Spirochaetes bacterium RIFOXYB1_FULL_32_8]HBD93566.1 hypothetical protein [Spirochaetia bacterium]
MKFKKICIFLITVNSLYSIPVVNQREQNISLSNKDVVANSKYLLENSMRDLNYADYITDSLLLYGLLWLNIGYNLPFRGDSISLITDQTGAQFTERLLLEPFANDRKEVVFDTINDSSGNTILDTYGAPMLFPNGAFYAKNVIEPFAFYSYGLYLRAKNYHPALYIGMMFSLSVLYEFTVRPFFMEASFEQLFKNPIAGITASIIFDELSSYLLTTPYLAAHVFAYILNPFKLLPTARVKPLLFFDYYKQSASLQVILEL